MSLYVNPNAPVYESIVGIGGIGNLVSFLIFSRQKFNKYNVRNMFRVSLVFQTFNLLLNINIFELSTVYCKVYISLLFILPAYTAWILVFISLERYFSVVFSTKKVAKLFSNRIFQMLSLFVLLLVCIFYYSPDWIYYELEYATLVNYSYYVYTDIFANQTVSTCHIDQNLFIITSYMNAFFASIIPFFILITSSILITYSMWVIRKRMNSNSMNSAVARRRSQRDFQFACTILSLDVIFLLFYFPNALYLIITNYFPSNAYSYSLVILQEVLGYFYQFSSGYNIFVFLLFNKLFRSEFLELLKVIGKNFLLPQTQIFS